MLPGKKTAALFVLGLFLFLPQPSLFCQSSAAGSAGSGRGDALTLKLAVAGPGNQLYFWFGHIGLVVDNKSTGQVKFYDWGVFSFENEDFFYNFAFGRLIYSCAVSRAEYNYKAYISNNRDITLYTLDLPPDKKEKILRFAENNVLPENRDYFYHLFKDNCATRIRDIIDMAVDGQFKAKYGNESGRFTFRQHVRRHTWFSPFFDWILNFLMGQDVDRPITVWDEMFLPSEIARRIGEFSFTGPDGKERPLVSSVETVHTVVDRPAVLDAPRLQWPRELLASLLFSVSLLLLYLFRGNRKGVIIFMGILQSVLGLFLGITGSLLFFMGFFTNHDYTYHNSNIIFANPLLLAMIPLGLIFASAGTPKKRFIAGQLLRAVWTYVLLGGLLTMVMKFSPAFYQQNQVDLALILPIALIMIIIMARMNRIAKR